MSIMEAGNKIKAFLEENLGRPAKIIKLSKTEGGWTGEAEVFEDSALIKSLGLPAKVQDRNIYEVVLSEDLEVLSYKQRKAGDEDGK